VPSGKTAIHVVLSVLKVWIVNLFTSKTKNNPYELYPPAIMKF
jgi:hypothetical protein